MLSNRDLKFRIWRCAEAMDHLVRNADGDELMFVHKGAGEIYCDFGRLQFRDGDYILLPRGTAWRVEPSAPTTSLLFEASNDAFRLPDKGLLGDHAIFDPAILETPHIDEAFLAQQGDSMWRIRIKRRDRISTVTFPHNPLDAIGWKGDLAPVRLNWRDIRPIMSHRYHVPPSAHTTFLTDRVIICTFVPRPFETDPAALKVPFFHSNSDFDEVNFLHSGDFFSRDHIHPGMFFFHPSGFPHGPHPKALEGALAPKAEGTNEVAVTLETREALDVSTEAERIEWSDYVDSWGAGDRRDAAD